MEEWRPCPDFEGVYEVSCRGRVRRVLHDHRTRIGRILRRSKSRGGPIVKLCHRKHQRTVRVQVLVAQAFIGPANGKCLRFVNDDPNDVRVENMYYGKRRAGTARGERNGMAKMSDAQALLALALLREGRTVSAVARRFGVSRRAIRFLRDREHWAHLRT